MTSGGAVGEDFSAVFARFGADAALRLWLNLSRRSLDATASPVANPNPAYAAITLRWEMEPRKRA